MNTPPAPRGGCSHWSRVTDGGGAARRWHRRGRACLRGERAGDSLDASAGNHGLRGGGYPRSPDRTLATGSHAPEPPHAYRPRTSRQPEVASAVTQAAERAHKLRPELVAYCSRQRIELWRKLDEEEAGQQGEAQKGQAPEGNTSGNEDETGEVAEAGKDTTPDASDP